MEPKVIIPLGISGSGKGTQAKLLCDKLGLSHVAMGDLLRSRKEKTDFSGAKVGHTIDAGRFVPSVLIMKILMDVFEQLKHQENFRGFVLDGALRKVPQAQFLDEAFEWYEWGKGVQVLLIDISEEEAMARLTKRRELETRADDAPDAIRSRMAEYKEYVVPVIDYYEKQGRLIRINGEQSIEDVHKDIMEVVGNDNH